MSARRAWVRRLLAGVVGVAGLLALTLLVWDADPSGEPESDTVAPTRTVTVVAASPGTYTSEVSGLAEVHPRWLSTLRAEVGGRLVTVASGIQPGSRVRAGQVLAVVDTTAWAANLAEAQNRVASAELSLLQARQEAQEARRSWEESGLAGDPMSALVLHEPQIAAAEAEITAARTAEGWARQQLERTRIRAPFDGVVTARYVSVGETVIEGEPVVALFATDVFELALPLPDDEWGNLPDPVIGASASLHDPGGGIRARATIVRDGGSVDPATRMRTLYLEIVDPLAADDPVLPGSFVEVRIPGRTIPGLLDLPEGVLTRRGLIWYLDSDDALRSFTAVPRFTRPGRIYVSEPDSGPARWRIVRYPLESYLAGQVVTPTSEGAGG